MGIIRPPCSPARGPTPTHPARSGSITLAYGYAQAYWTEQFTKSVFVDNAIKAMQGKNTMTAAVAALAILD